MKNIVCNLIYNNGGEAEFVGFKGVCTIDNIIHNIDTGPNRWCSQSGCQCRSYYDSGFEKKHLPTNPCTESYLFEGWEFNAGFTFNSNKPFLMNKVGSRKIAILTTRFSGTSEADRKIVGLFKIKNVLDNGNRVTSYKRYRLRLPLQEAKMLNFWAYYRNERAFGKGDLTPQWSSSRFRYLEDAQVAAILHDLKDVVQNESTQSMILDLLENDFPDFSNNRPLINGAIEGNIVKKIWLKRKYGSGGESQQHKDLKNYIANNPQLINLSKNNFTPIVEHLFLSGDIVDILFVPKNSLQNIVVEIELDNVMPGIHQAIKYRVLRCAQLNQQLNSDNVKATVVAWKFTDKEKEICKKYGIDYFEIKL